jgi:hypothetical protein
LSVEKVDDDRVVWCDIVKSGGVQKPAPPRNVRLGLWQRRTA